jgi:hypothetical protein
MVLLRVLDESFSVEVAASGNLSCPVEKQNNNDHPLTPEQAPGKRPFSLKIPGTKLIS